MSTPYQVMGEDISPETFNNDSRWERVIKARNLSVPNQPATPPAKLAPPAQPPAGAATPASAPARAVSQVKKTLRHSPLPKLPKTDFKIVFRPGCGLNLRDKLYPVKAYVAAPDNAVRGILYNAIYNQAQDEIFQDLVELNPSKSFTIVDARQLGRTKSILVTFINTKEVPPQLNFCGTIYTCHPFRAKTEACFNCWKPGHRADVCPQALTHLCHRCGVAHPASPTPDCTPLCILCGGAHFTGSKRCKVRFERAGNPKPTPNSTPILPASDPGAGTTNPGGTPRSSRSRQRSSSRSRARSRTGSRHRSRSSSFPPLPGSKTQPADKQVSWRPKPSPPEKENAELRAQIHLQSLEIADLRQQVKALLGREQPQTSTPPAQPAQQHPPPTKLSSPSPPSISSSRAASPVRNPPSKRKAQRDSESEPTNMTEQMAVLALAIERIEQGLTAIRTDTTAWMSNISTRLDALGERQSTQEAAIALLRTHLQRSTPTHTPRPTPLQSPATTSTWLSTHTTLECGSGTAGASAPNEAICSCTYKPSLTRSYRQS
ncbi:hypothetical protein HPB47_011954 [Ixodes persulcatus]|uniref:Uncharacterized protein n=1 Tax=Ixodes persulcatus TaxID=34615 RepID=A0AC60NV22_IXOPE|nr:hypothetical protein HPB47_011954 [Ixodes persulcatus]